MSALRLCLNMIVKNEIANLPRCLDSTVGHIHAVVVYDTGSTDGTPDYIGEHCFKHRLPCTLVRGHFEDFSQARNMALTLAQQSRFAFDYILLMDADMELVVDGPLPPLTAQTYTLLQRQGGLAYYNTRLVTRKTPAVYHGVTHEYIGTDDLQQLPGDVWWFKDHATGSNRGDKYERDKRLLEGYLVDHPGDPRSLFYLAQTYRDSGDQKKAIELYERRIAAGGWEEEVWFSQYQIAKAHMALGNEPAYVQHLLKAYDMRPQRAEALYDLARHFREKKDQQQSAWMFADAGSKVPYPRDLLFVEQWMYQYGFLEEKSILGAYVANRRGDGARACNKLMLMPEAPARTRDNAKRNLYWYLQPLQTYAAQAHFVRIPDLNPDKTYVNTNPSVAVVDNKLKAIVRTVSYRIRPDGTYDYNGLSAIRTTSFLVDVKNLESAGWTVFNPVELKRPTRFPEPVFKDVLDVEDYRLIPYRGELWANGCVLEQNEQAWREQFLVKLHPTTGEVTDWQRVVPEGSKVNEKNWMPIVQNEEIKWMYRPGWVLRQDGSFQVKHQNTVVVDDLSGGGQLVPLDGGWLGIVHTAHQDPINGKRYYWHRFVYFDADFRLQKMSEPFVFFDKQIEFAAGLALYEGNVVVSFGVLDREAWIAVIPEHDVRFLLWRP